jgi:DNA-binding NarL/FixJ family response regulator
MIRTIVADDEEPARERLRELLSEHPDVSVIAEAQSQRNSAFDRGSYLLTMVNGSRVEASRRQSKRLLEILK